MANPNKTVYRFRQRIGFPDRERTRAADPFVLWLSEQARSGKTFDSIEAAREAFSKTEAATE